MAAKHTMVTLHLDPTARDRLKPVCKRRSLSQVELMQRLVGWFSHQDDFIQTAVLQTLTQESMAAVAKSALKTSSRN